MGKTGKIENQLIVGSVSKKITPQNSSKRATNHYVVILVSILLFGKGIIFPKKTVKNFSWYFTGVWFLKNVWRTQTVYKQVVYYLIYLNQCGMLVKMASQFIQKIL